LEAQRKWTGGLVTIHEVLEIVIPYREREGERERDRRGGRRDIYKNRNRYMDG
jgi:hypothetical protein